MSTTLLHPRECSCATMPCVCTTIHRKRAFGFVTRSCVDPALVVSDGGILEDLVDRKVHGGSRRVAKKNGPSSWIFDHRWSH